MTRKHYWIIAAILFFMAGVTTLFIKQYREIAALKREAAVADVILHQHMQQKLQHQKTPTVSKELETRDQPPTNDKVFHAAKHIPVETPITNDKVSDNPLDTEEERPLGLDPVDYNKVPGIPTLEELTTTYKLKMMVDPDGAESLMPAYPKRSDYNTHEDYKLANTAWLKFMYHAAETVQKSRQSK